MFLMDAYAADWGRNFNPGVTAFFEITLGVLAIKTDDKFTKRRDRVKDLLLGT